MTMSRREEQRRNKENKNEIINSGGRGKRGMDWKKRENEIRNEEK